MEAQTATKKEGGMRLGPYLLMEAQLFPCARRSGRDRCHVVIIGRIDIEILHPRSPRAADNQRL